MSTSRVDGIIRGLSNLPKSQLKDHPVCAPVDILQCGYFLSKVNNQNLTKVRMTLSLSLFGSNSLWRDLSILWP